MEMTECWCTGACVWRSIPSSGKSPKQLDGFFAYKVRSPRHRCNSESANSWANAKTVSRAARRVLRVFIDWGALLETQNKGIYRGAAKRSVNDLPLGIWVIKALLLARGEKLQPVPSMLRDNRLFPFDIASPPLRDLEKL